jgi:hypothetical protein
MKPVTLERTFGEWLWRWAWRGTLWAMPSAFFAWMAGYQNVPAIGAMGVGIVFWWFVYASVSSSPQLVQRYSERRFVRRLWIVIRVKTLMAVGWPLAFLVPLFGLVGIGDMYGGLVAIWGTKVLGGVAANLGSGPIWVPQFGWTLVATLCQGAMISLQVLLVAGVACLFPPYRQHKPIVSLEGATSAGGQ